jgi:phosphoribosylglycinamide formyltransferase-1
MGDFKLAILASGEGSTGEVLFDIASLVIVSNSNAGIINRVARFNQDSGKNLLYIVLNRNEFSSKEEFGEELLKVLNEHQINFISQNGWTVFTPENVLKQFEGRIINAHPGPLDSGHLDFGGKGMNDLAVHSAVLNFSRKINRPFKTEITLHKVTNEFDKGEVVAWKEVEILSEDTPTSLQQRLKEEERKLLRKFWEEVSKTGEIKTVKREGRVVHSGEEEVLEEAKKTAIAEYS